MKTIIARRFQFKSVGHSYRSTEMEAALGLAQLEEAELMIKKRRANAAYLTNKLTAFSNKIQLPKIRKDCEHSFMMYPIVIKEESKKGLVNFLEKNGVETRDMLPLTNQPVYKDLLGWNEEEYPVAKWINENGFYIGCHQNLIPLELDYITDLFDKYFHKNAKSQKVSNILLLLLNDNKIESVPRRENLPEEIFQEICIVIKDRLTLSQKIVDIITIENYTIIETGKKSILHTLISKNWNNNPDNLIFFPLNTGFTKQDISRVVLASNPSIDMVLGSRFISRGGRQIAGNFSLTRNFGNRFFNLLVNLLFLGNVTDSFSPIRAIRFNKLKELSTYGFWSSSSLLFITIQALKCKWILDEVPTVEIVKENETKRILYSILPSIWILIREFFKGSSKS